MSSCPLCAQPCTNLRSSVKCDRCKKTVCSSCCRSSEADLKHHFCISCIRQQKKAEDPNDDRPKWLREAQQLHKQDMSSSGRPTSTKQQQFKPTKAVDDRPKWLREAHEKEAALASQRQKPEHSQGEKTDAIRSRLDKLKEEMATDKPALSDDEIRRKLAALRDQDPNTAAASGQSDYSVLRMPAEKTETEEIESLIAQMKEQAKLEDEDVDLIKELEARLRRLKSETAALGISTSGTSSPVPKPAKKDKKSQNVADTKHTSERMDVGSSDEEAEQVERFLTEKLPESVIDEASYDEMFCVICPEDPAVICLDCDKDMYCMRCFRECHKEWDAMDHRTKTIPKRRSKI